MKKTIITLCCLIASTTITFGQMNTFHDFTVKTIDGKTFNLSELRGKKVLVVNTASKCGLTPQYEQLQALQEKYGGDSFTVIGFPANNFGGQEPGTNSEIQTFCTKNYGVSFPMMEKISVRGKEQHPVYQWLTQKEQNGKQDVKMKWNFQKFMIDENGNWVGFIEPKVLPDDEKIVNWIEGK